MRLCMGRGRVRRFCAHGLGVGLGLCVCAWDRVRVRVRALRLCMGQYNVTLAMQRNPSQNHGSLKMIQT